MANYRLKDALLYASLLPEATYNVPFDEAAEFAAISTRDNVAIIPTVDKKDDAGQTGTGTHFATHVCNDYWTQSGVALLTRTDFFAMFGRFWLRAFGGTVATAASGPGYKHTARLQQSADGINLPGTDIIGELGPDEVLLAGMVVAQAALAKQRNTDPDLSFQFVGSGKHLNPHGIASLPAYAPPNVCGSNPIVLKYTNPASAVIDLGASGCQFVDLQCAVNNQLVLNDRCPGDASLTQNGGTALHVGRVPRGDQTLDLGFGILVNDDNDEYGLHLSNESVTDVVIGIRGALIGGSTYYELGVEVPKANFRAVTPAENQGNAARSYVLQPIYNAAAGYLARAYVINATSSNFR